MSASFRSHPHPLRSSPHFRISAFVAAQNPRQVVGTILPFPTVSRLYTSLASHNRDAVTSFSQSLLPMRFPVSQHSNTHKTYFSCELSTTSLRMKLIIFIVCTLISMCKTSDYLAKSIARGQLEFIFESVCTRLTETRKVGRGWGMGSERARWRPCA